MVLDTMQGKQYFLCPLVHEPSEVLSEASWQMSLDGDVK